MTQPIHSNRSRILGIVPPHILEAIAQNGTPDQCKRARHALAADASFRSARSVEGVRGRGPSHRKARPASTQRSIYTTNNTTMLPGTLVRGEGNPPSRDPAVDEAYDGLGATFDLYHKVYKRNSIDDAGLPLLGTVHYDQKYDNAFWNGSQMVFGDGDGEYFNRFTISVDVIGHELTHGVTGDTANLDYQNQSGALNESVSDVFGSLVKQYAASPKQTADKADWLIGAGLFTKKVKGVALRSMKAPGTAFDDPVLGKDPQPADMAHYVKTTSDSGGVHLNSGIPNHAFYLVAVALGGYAWEKAGMIWYKSLLDSRLASNATFLDFANVTAENAATLFGAKEQQAVVTAWNKVGINVQLLVAAGPGEHPSNGS